jgi:hypothetical protein
MLKYAVIVLMLCAASAWGDSTTYTGATADTSKWSIGGGDQAAPQTHYTYDIDINCDSFYYRATPFIKLENLQADLLAGSPGRTYDSCVLRIVLTNAGNFSGTDSTLIWAYDVTRVWDQNLVSYDSASAGVPWTTDGGDFGSVRSDTIVIDAASVYLADTLTLHFNVTYVRSIIEGTNYGFALFARNKNGMNGGVNFGANQNLTVAQRPIFTVYYHTTPEYTQPKKVGGPLTLGFGTI